MDIQTNPLQKYRKKHHDTFFIAQKLKTRRVFCTFAGWKPSYTDFMDVKQSMQEILEAESKAVLNIPITDAYEEAVNLIVEQVKH